MVVVVSVVVVQESHKTGHLFIKLGPIIESLQLAAVFLPHRSPGSIAPSQVAVVVVAVVVVDETHELQSTGQVSLAAGMGQYCAVGSRPTV
jgi:hypothetical protein